MASVIIGRMLILALFCLGWLSLVPGQTWHFFLTTQVSVWGTKPVLSYVALTGSLVQPMQEGARLSPAQVEIVQEIARRESESLSHLVSESLVIILDPQSSQEEKRLRISKMGFNPRVAQIVRQSSLSLEAALGKPAYRRLVRWIEQRWTIERYLHGPTHHPQYIAGCVSPTEFMRSPSIQLYNQVLPGIRSKPQAPLQQRTFRIFATHYDSKGAYYVALPDQCLKLTNGGLKTCADKGYQVGKEYNAYVGYKKKGTAARVGEVGPWNIDDNYWATLGDPTPRRMFADLALGMPEAQAAYFNGYNGGLDQYGRKVTGPFGIDISRKVGDDIGLDWGVNDWVNISYLWTADWGSGGGGSSSNPGSSSASVPSATAIQTLAPVGSVILNTPDTEGRIIHQVQPGETLWSIAVAYQASLQSLYTINNLKEGDVLFSGQTITVRLPGTGPTATATMTLSPTTTQRPSSTPRPTSTSQEATPDISLSSTAMTTQLSNDQQINWGRFLLLYDPVLIVIVVFMVVGTTLTLMGYFLGRKKE